MNASNLGTSELPGWTGVAKNFFPELISITGWAKHQLSSPVYYCSGRYSKSIEYISGCSWPDVWTMNAFELGTNELSGWRGAAKNLFQERSSITAWATHQFASPVYQCYGNYSKSIEYQCRCSWRYVQMMNAYNLGTSELSGWRGAAKNLLQERLLITAWATHQFASPVYYCYGSYSKSIEYQCGCSWRDVQTMKASKLGTTELPGWRGVANNLYPECSWITAWATHQFASPVYYCYGSYSKWTEYQSKCFWPDVRTMNASKISTSELPGWRGAAKNLFQKHSSITAWATLQFTSPVYNCYISYSKSIEYQWTCYWQDVLTMNAYKLCTSELPGWREAAKNLFQERWSIIAWATHQFASPVYYWYCSYSKSIEYQCRCSWLDVQTMNAYKLGTNELPGWRGAAKNLL